jgi:hypothetical protein
MKNIFEEIKVNIGGATLVVGSDRYPYTVVDISKAGNRVTIQADRFKVLHKGFTEDQSYEYSRNTEGQKILVSLRRDGKWKVAGESTLVVMGVRQAYIDPSF